MSLNVENEDLYELLEVASDCSISEIKKAYRKKALLCHPDKNRDNPDAAKDFHKLTKVLEILTDESARKAYDRVLRGRKEAALRNKQLDSKRQKLKKDLEDREQRLKAQKSADELLKDEIERLRKDGSKQVQEEMDFIMREIHKENRMHDNDESQDNSKYRIKLKWQAKKTDTTNGGYTQELLHRFLSKYGDIDALVMSVKNGSGLVVFTTKRAAEMAVEIEKGLASNPLELSWVDKTMSTGKRGTSSTIKDSDYESLVLTRLRQQDERKRLIEQMMAEDDD